MISIIVPTYNEEKNLRNFIYNLYCIDEINNCEVIIVDGGSSDKTLDILEELSYFGYKHFISNNKGRANQMNFGASLSKGDILWFIHADSILQKDVIQKIVNSNYDVGCLKIQFYPNNFKMIINAKMSTNRVKYSNIAFGDQGIFLKKDIFNAIGGYSNIPIMEDYKLSQDLTNLGFKINILDSVISTSSRRYRNNTLKTMLQMKRLQKMYRDGVDINLIAKYYKDIR
ncbi:TIGR04283 family arsenosugar biosynthesis glycosyltransferase [Gemelliphila palaticanis]|uniref:4,4'-diaponeurosporenoate glycosyltransferase n=1 Tax=Gemelliphila palaticanis TaxID=81950 RepID=A0ABX2T2W5_9BACL|nr:TIGR04283 family arsenosugar biosynthesis glycosyltransferase [Gemella palaticanis]MBF0716038.1 TIGR04283 family arsenosugar biosynthesis glycosyltransferase [Gemella palaticanis]NYS47968.1 TIGR04283 family arsenosugar biosynthesis glycosyltransferase [Gemella palaticanis]